MVCIYLLCQALFAHLFALDKLVTISVALKSRTLPVLPNTALSSNLEQSSIPGTDFCPSACCTDQPPFQRLVCVCPNAYRCSLLCCSSLQTWHVFVILFLVHASAESHNCRWCVYSL